MGFDIEFILRFVVGALWLVGAVLMLVGDWKSSGKMILWGGYFLIAMILTALVKEVFFNE